MTAVRGGAGQYERQVGTEYMLNAVDVDRQQM